MTRKGYKMESFRPAGRFSRRSRPWPSSAPSRGRAAAWGLDGSLAAGSEDSIQVSPGRVFSHGRRVAPNVKEAPGLVKAKVRSIPICVYHKNQLVTAVEFGENQPWYNFWYKLVLL